MLEGEAEDSSRLEEYHTSVGLVRAKLLHLEILKLLEIEILRLFILLVIYGYLDGTFTDEIDFAKVFLVLVDKLPTLIGL